MGSNVAERLRPRIPPSVPAPKIAELREGGLANVGVQTHPIAPLHHRSCLLLPLPVVFLGEANDDGPEEPISLLCFSESDTVEVRMAAVRKKACQSDVLYATWLDDQIHTGHNDVKRRDSTCMTIPYQASAARSPTLSVLRFPIWKRSKCSSLRSSYTIQKGFVDFTTRVLGSPMC